MLDNLFHRKVFVTVAKKRREGYVCRCTDNGNVIVMLSKSPRHKVERTIKDLEITKEYERCKKVNS